MKSIEPHIEAMIRRLAAKGRPVDEIAFATRIGPNTIAEILASPADSPKAKKQKPGKPKPNGSGG